MLRNFDGSWNKDLIFKILFALEVALMPMIIAANMMAPAGWVIAFLSIVILAKLCMVLLKDQANHWHVYFDAIGNAIVMCFTLITFACFGYLNIWLAVATSILVVLEELARVFFFYKPNKSYIDALNFAFEMFMYLTLGGMIIVFWTNMLLKIATVALLFCSAVIVLIQGFNFVYFYLINKNKKVKTVKKSRE